MDSVIDCQNRRRFGVEIELNTFDNEIKSVEKLKRDIPCGADEIALLIRETLKKNVSIESWDYNFNNNNWIIKPDRSCGMEVCTPVLKGYHDLIDLVKLIHAFKDNSIKADERCSLHVHVNIADLNKTQLASVIAWYIKCEAVFMDSVPVSRKINRYCQMLGITDFIRTDTNLDPDHLLSSVSNVKYYSLNAYHFMKGGGFDKINTRKKTIEFRIGENSLCLDPYGIKNWIRFLLHFVETTKNLPLPKPYEPLNSWSGLCWLEPDDVFDLLGFNKPCTAGFMQIKYWFLQRILCNQYDTGMKTLFSNEGRFFARNIFLEYYQKALPNIRKLIPENEDLKTLLYDYKYAK